MVNSLNYCSDFLTASGTSSTEYLDHCFQRICNTTRCDGQCYFINDHTYTILKKICRRIFKAYSKAQSLKTYTIFDGGNSVNVRIYRSRQQGDGYHGEYKKGQNILSKLNKNTISNDALKLELECSDKLGKKKPDTNAVYTIHHKKKHFFGKVFRRSTQEESNQNNNEVDIVRTRKKSKKDTSRKETFTYDEEDFGNMKDHTSKKDMINEDYDDPYTEKHKQNKKIARNERRKSNQKQGTTEDYNDNKTTEQKRSAKFGEKKKTLKALHSIENAKNYNNNNVFDDTFNIRRGLSSSQRKSKGYIDDYGDKNRQSLILKGNRKSRGTKDVDYRFIKDLRKKVRRGEIVGMDYDKFSENARHSLKSRLSNPKKSFRIVNQISKYQRHRKETISRVDEIRTCDYLRALMEQRELDQLHCCFQFHTRNCNPQICNPCFCTCPAE